MLSDAETVDYFYIDSERFLLDNKHLYSAT